MTITCLGRNCDDILVVRCCRSSVSLASSVVVVILLLFLLSPLLVRVTMAPIYAVLNRGRCNFFFLWLIRFSLSLSVFTRSSFLLLLFFFLLLDVQKKQGALSFFVFLTARINKRKRATHSVN